MNTHANELKNCLLKIIDCLLYTSVLCDCRNFGIGEINVVTYACRIGKTDKRRSDHQRRAHGEAEGRSACQLSVSYTHLDVYKRQANVLRCHSFWWIVHVFFA